MEKVLYESADVARVFNLTPAGVRYNLKIGRLRAAAKTRRGGALFTEKELAEFRRNRQAERNAQG
jgi:hypothetical protein